MEKLHSEWLLWICPVIFLFGLLLSIKRDIAVCFLLNVPFNEFKVTGVTQQ